MLVSEDRFGAMFDVRIPTTNESVASTLPATLLQQFNTWVPVYPILPLGYVSPRRLLPYVSTPQPRSRQRVYCLPLALESASLLVSVSVPMSCAVVLATAGTSGCLAKFTMKYQTLSSLPTRCGQSSTRVCRLISEASKHGVREKNNIKFQHNE